MAHPTIPLDPAILQWVLLPLVGIMILLGVCRHYVTVLLKSKPTVNITQNRDNHTLSYAKNILAHGCFLPPQGYKARVHHQLQSALNRKVENTQMQAMMNPDMMGNMMKNNMVMLIPNIGMMSLVSYFFGGFVIAKFPFALSARFKGMVQRGVEIDNLDGCYVTSLSLYFLIMFGLQGVLKLVLGENEGDETQMMANQMNMQQAQAQQGQDMPKLFAGMKEDIQFNADHYKYQLADATKKLLNGE